MSAGLLCTCLTLASAPALAAGAADSKLPLDARISANAPAEWDPSTGVAARAAEADDLQSRIADTFRRAIAARGWPTGDDAPAVLVFRYGVQATADPNKSPVQLRGGMGSASSDEEAEVLLRLDLLDRDTAPPTKERTMVMTVSDRQRRVLWQGHATASVGEDGEMALADALATRILDFLGRDAFDESMR